MASWTISETPKHHPDCCLSISTILLDTITTTILKSITSSSTCLVLSIGSGTGFLESLLQAHWSQQSPSEPTLLIEGVEVYSSLSPVNRYLPDESVNIVQGTWDISARVINATVLIFVYPRQPSLVVRYLEYVVREDCNVQMVIWLGPRADWEEFKICFENVEVVESVDIDLVENCGLVEYETMAVVRLRNDAGLVGC